MSKGQWLKLPHLKPTDPPKFVGAIFKSRPNRFVVLAKSNGRTLVCHLPNPGRLMELLFPGAGLLLSLRSGGVTQATVEAVLAADGPVPLHTHRANDTAEALLRSKFVPGLEDWTVTAREVSTGRSRFDFLLTRGDRRLWLEVKSCTLFAGCGAYFPDAPSERAVRHLDELARLARGGDRSAVLVLVNSPRPRWFAPAWHTDLAFARTLLAARERVDIIPLALSWNESLESRVAGVLPVPWHFLERCAEDGGWLLSTGERDGAFFWSLERGDDLTRLSARRRRHGVSTFSGTGDFARAHLDLWPLRDESVGWDVAREMAFLGTVEWTDGVSSGGRLRRGPRGWREFIEGWLRLAFVRHDGAIAAELGLEAARRA